MAGEQMTDGKVRAVIFDYGSVLTRTVNPVPRSELGIHTVQFVDPDTSLWALEALLGGQDQGESHHDNPV
jgi:hypothetical protein